MEYALLLGESCRRRLTVAAAGLEANDEPPALPLRPMQLLLPFKLPSPKPLGVSVMLAQLKLDPLRSRAARLALSSFRAILTGFPPVDIWAKRHIF